MGKGGGFREGFLTRHDSKRSAFDALFMECLFPIRDSVSGITGIPFRRDRRRYAPLVVAVEPHQHSGYSANLVGGIGHDDHEEIGRAC